MNASSDPLTIKELSLANKMIKLFLYLFLHYSFPMMKLTLPMPMEDACIASQHLQSLLLDKHAPAMMAELGKL